MASKPTATPTVKVSKRKLKKLAAEVTSPGGSSDVAAALLGDKVTDSANGSQRGEDKAEKGEKEYIKEVSK